MSSTAVAAADSVADGLRQPQPLAGLRHQLRFIARRDRVRAAVWIVAVVAIVIVSAASVMRLYSSPADLASYAALAQANAAFRALAGPGYGLDAPTEGAVVMNETSLYTYVTVALMAIFLVVRHTRAEEDSARAELVRAAPVGRGATLTATVMWVSGIVVTIAFGLSAGLIALGLPATGSVAFGAATAASGVVFVGISAVCAQVASSGRSANSMAGIVLGASFLLRAVGDMGDGLLTWLSPLGIAQAIRPFADERWWVLAPLALVAAGTLTAAGVLLTRRDLGAGFVGQRPGHANASALLRSALALAARLQRGSVVGWAIAMAVMGVSFGLVADEADSLADNEAIADIMAQAGAGSLTESFLATTLLMLALITSGFTVASVLRLRTEERAGRVETLLSTPMARRQWWSSHVVVAVAASTAIMVCGGLTAGLGYAGQSGDWGALGPILAGSLVWCVPLVVVAALTAALVAAVPRAAMAAWAAVAWSVLVGVLAETLNLPQWMRDVSPFEHVPALPAESFDVVPVAVLLAVAGVLAAVGALAIDRRDLG